MKELLIIIVLLNGVMAADSTWVRVIGWSNVPSPPEKEILKSDTSQVFISNTIFGFMQQDTMIDNKDFKRINIPEEPVDQDTIRQGRAQIPYLRLLIAVPDSCGFDITVEEHDYTLFEDYLLYPVPRIVFETDTTGGVHSREVYAYDTSFYQTDTIYPGIFYEVNEQVHWRDQGVLEVFIYPVQYNPVQELMYFYNKLNVTIGYSGEVVENEDGLGPFEEMGRRSLLNYPGIDRQPGPHPPPSVHYYTDLLNTENIADYIVVIHEDILDDEQGAYWIDAIARWRVDHNDFDVGIVKMQDIYEQFGPLGNDSTQLRNFLIYAYEHWQAPAVPDGRFAYCLFIGDWDYVPTRLYMDETWYAADEHYFRDLSTPPDTWEDIMLGRWPVKATEIQDLGIIAGKTITYESEPDIAPHIHNWRRQGLVIEGLPGFMPLFKGYFLDISYDTSAVRQAGLTPPEFQSRVTSSLNQGDITAIYCGHGNANGWVWYYSENLTNLNNADSLPMVLSLVCYTGSFQSDYNRPGWICFGENFIFEDDGGCVAFYGATKKTLLSYCESDGKEALNRMLGYQTWILGKCLVNLNGKKDFCLLGDPALDLGDYTALPTYPDLVIRPRGIDISLGAPYPYPPTNSIIPIHAKVWNIGHVAVSDIRVKFTVRSEETVIYTNTIIIPEINAADTVLAVTNWNTALTHPDQIGDLGDLSFTVEADPNNRLTESWEGNNVASITRPVVLYAPGWSRKVSRVSQPALADLDQAGSVEIIYAGYDSVYAFAPDNSVVPGWPKFFKGVYGLVLGDIDNNGKIEVIALSPESIKVYDYQGAVLSGWPVYIHLEDYEFTGLPALGRIESDVARCFGYCGVCPDDIR